MRQRLLEKERELKIEIERVWNEWEEKCRDSDEGLVDLKKKLKEKEKLIADRAKEISEQKEKTRKAEKTRDKLDLKI